MTDTYTAAQRAARFGPDNQFAPTVGGTAKLPLAPVRMGGLVLDFEDISERRHLPVQALHQSATRGSGCSPTSITATWPSSSPIAASTSTCSGACRKAIAELLMLEPPLATKLRGQ